MKQTSRIISTYSADTMGVCSALFELGGMTVMHDASGCNSTYSTHDEPRWYDMDSMVYISALTEMEAIMGDDGKIVEDIAEAAAELQPKFIAIAGTPIPTMTGFDFDSVAALTEQRTHIPTLGFSTTGMNTYIHGASMAFEALARRFVKDNDGVQGGCKRESGSKIKVNVIGLTPLDFSVNGTDESICGWLRTAGFEIVSRWAMGSTLDEIAMAGGADVNLVVSASGLAAARILRERFGTPYVAGLPIGSGLASQIEHDLLSCAKADGGGSYKDAAAAGFAKKAPAEKSSIVIIGEAVTSLALAGAIEIETGRTARVLCATEPMGAELRPVDAAVQDEDDIIRELDRLCESGGLAAIIADPLYKPICPPDARFIALPHEAFSGRLYRSDIPNLVEEADRILREIGHE